MPENQKNGGSGTESSASSSAGVRVSNSDREKLQKKRRKNGLCPNCGEVHTHKKNWKQKMVPQTIHGVVYEGTCLKCNAPPKLANVKFNYGLGWERAVRATDYKLVWERASSGVKSSFMDQIAYVRKIEYFGGGDGGVCSGRVTLVTVDSSTIESTVECSNSGRNIVSYSDIERAQKMDLYSKINWLQETCARIGNEGQQVRINVRQKHLVDDAIKAVMSFSKADMQKEWILERERELGELTSHEFYRTIIQQIFCSDAGLWHKCATNEARMEIDVHGELTVPNHLKYFRFIGRLLAKALIGGETLRCCLTKYIYKLLAGWPIMLDDLIEVDVNGYEHLTSLKEMGADEINALGLHFTSSIVLWDMPTRVPLVTSGFDKAVSRENVGEYIDAYFKYQMFGRCKDQISELLLGWHDVIPEPLIAIFDFEELETLMCGDPTNQRASGGNHSSMEEKYSNSTARSSSIMDAAVTVGNSIPEAHVIDDHVYQAVIMDGAPQADSTAVSGDVRKSRIQRGQCPSCGLQTHTVSGLLKKKHHPITNEYVLAGRCLFCYPTNSPVSLISAISDNASGNLSSSSANEIPPTSSRGEADGMVVGENTNAVTPSMNDEPNEATVATVKPDSFALRTYSIPSRCPFKLIITRGSVLDFSYPSTRYAIVNGAESKADEIDDLDGIDGAICHAGGQTLLDDRISFPVLSCPVGSAAITGPKTYGDLKCPYVIHAMRPRYHYCETDEDYANSDKLLANAYASSLERGKGAHLEAIAFSLLCAGDSAWPKALDDVLSIAIEAICGFEGYPDLKEVHLYAFNTEEEEALSSIADQMFMQSTSNESAEGIEEVNDDDEQRPSDQTTVDDSLDALGRAVAEAAARQNLPFEPTCGDGLPAILNRDLHFQPVNPSGLTYDTYFRRDDRSRYTEASSLSDHNHGITNDAVRRKLSAVVECLDIQPAQLTSSYVDEIKTETLLGKGYFGTVRLGLDEILGKKFALKMIRPVVIEEALVHRLADIQKSFQNEIKVLSQLQHPNIAPLYGYYLGEDCLRNTCLVYELAMNGSLDKFWNEENSGSSLQHERLSEAKTRARIALEVATVLRYMHEGLSGGAKCFHRDIKSANICLTVDFSARIIDCGLAKYVTEEPGSFNTSAGATGTPGYTCPQYLLQTIPYQSTCDVFSFGVVLCELIIGRLSGPREQQHHMTYGEQGPLIENPRTPEDDADVCVDWNDRTCLKKMSSLASKCMRFHANSRPKIGDVVREMQHIVNQAAYVGSEPQLNRSLGASQPTDNSLITRCDFCGESSTQCVTCGGNDKQHTHCNNCLQSALERNMHRFRYGGLCCLKDGCNSKRFSGDDLAKVVSPDILDSYNSQRGSHFVQMVGNAMMNQVEVRFQQMQELLLQLSAGNGMPCPSLFILVEADSPGSGMHPREWARNTASVKLYLHFVCAHSLQPVRDKYRIKVRYHREWMKAIAPALNLSLDLLQLAVSVFVGRDLPLDFAKMKRMDEWVKTLLDPSDQEAIEEVSRCGGSKNGMSPGVKTLVGDSLSFVAEKAAAQNVRWQSELVPVYDYEKKEPTFVMKQYANNDRYRRESDIF